jgi:CheY-like chemotaxis protein
MPLLLVLEDTSADLHKAADVALRAGFTEIEARRFASDAKIYLEKAMREQGPMPDAMVIDLDLGIESGFELVRFWHGTPQLRSIAVVIWSMMDEQREMCGFFGVQHFVSKHGGSEALYSALVAILQEEVTPASA